MGDAPHPENGVGAPPGAGVFAQGCTGETDRDPQCLGARRGAPRDVRSTGDGGVDQGLEEAGQL
ncbi:hypothetical protein [Streptomyces sp. NPDC055060]